MQLHSLVEPPETTQNKLEHKLEQNWWLLLKSHVVLLLFFVFVFGMMQKWEHWKNRAAGKPAISSQTSQNSPFSSP